MKKVFYVIKDAFKNIDYKSKRTWVLFGLLIMIGLLSSLYISYGYYLKSGTKNVVISGKASFGDADLTLQIYLQDRDSSGNAVSNSYSRGYYIPKVNYTYESAKTVCGTGITLTYNSTTYEFEANTSQKGICKVYFAATGTVVPNATFSLNVEDSLNSGKYTKMGSLPNNDYVYEINSTRTSCTDPSATLTIAKRKILVESAMDLDCDIYVDVDSTSGGRLYTITLNPSGGSLEQTTTTAVNGEAYGELPTPTKSGEIFLGWFTAATGGTQITEATIASLTANQTLYAHWETCFAENTLIEIWDRKKKKRRKKKIKDILIGDVVYTYDYTIGKVVTSKVKDITINKTREIYHLVFENDELLTTADHPFCVSGAGYLNASMLKKGYDLIGSDGKSHIIKDIYVESLDYEKEMYCLVLENGDSLLVGQNGVVALAAFTSVLLVMGFAIKPSSAFAVTSAS